MKLFLLSFLKHGCHSYWNLASNIVKQKGTLDLNKSIYHYQFLSYTFDDYKIPANRKQKVELCIMMCKLTSSLHYIIMMRVLGIFSVPIYIVLVKFESQTFNFFFLISTFEHENFKVS